MQWLFDTKKRDTKLPQVIRAAVKLFVTSGIEATTTKQIAEEADVAEGTLYRHFKSKEEMANSIFLTHLQAFTNELDKASQPLANTKDKLRALISCFFAFYESERSLFEYVIQSEHREMRRYPSTLRHPYYVVKDIIEDGIKSGQIPEQDSVLASAFIIGMVIRTSVFRSYNTIQDSLIHYVDQVTEACWKVLQ